MEMDLEDGEIGVDFVGAVAQQRHHQGHTS
jgi:hypothetical protein